MSRRFLVFAVFGIILIAIGEWGFRKGRFSTLDQTWLEFCIGNTRDRLSLPAVTTVRIEDGYEPISLSTGDGPANAATLSRLDYATILALLAKFQPQSVAFAPIPSFDENLILNRTELAPLKDAAMKLPRLIVASAVSNDGEDAKEAASLDYPALEVEGDASSLLTFTRTVRYPDPQILANGIPAFKVIESARDLKTRGSLRVPLLARRGEQVIPSLTLAAVATHAGVPLDQIRIFMKGKHSQITVGEVYTIPIAADGTLTIPARSGFGTSPLTKSSTDTQGKLHIIDRYGSLTVDELAYTGAEDDEVAKRLLADLQSRFESLRENLVLIGFDRTADRRIASETGEMLSETSLIARAIATIQSGRYIYWWPLWGRWLAVLAIFFLATLLFRLPRRKFIPVYLLTGLSFFALVVAIFSSTLTWTPPFVLFSLFLLMFLVGLIVPSEKPQAMTKAGVES